MAKYKKNIKNSSNFVEEQSLDSQMSDNESNFDLENSDDNNSDTQTKVDKKTLSSILARVTALENENKELKDKAKNKSVIQSNTGVSRTLKSNEKTCITTKKTFKKRHKRPESSLECSSSEQESDNMKVCKEDYQLYIYSK
jgi:hypothetical protein